MENKANDFLPVKVLHIALGSGNFGGAARFAMNYYSHMDKKKIRFDFLFCNKNSLVSMEKKQILSDSNIVALGAIRNSGNSWRDYFTLYKEVKCVLRKESYSIVHIDSGSIYIQVCCLLASYMSGSKVRIAHSHSAGEQLLPTNFKNKLKCITKSILQFIIRLFATNYFACSQMAGENLFGKRGINSDKYMYVKNAIEISKYSYNIITRSKIRKELGIADKTILFGHVGRIDKVKNHRFLLNIFEEYYKINNDSELIIIGDGPLFNEIESLKNINIAKEKIRLMGESSNVNELMQAMDVLLLPSIYEGLSIVAVEAQASGLPIFASDTISKEHNINNNVKFIPIDRGTKIWVEEISKCCIRKRNLEGSSIVASAGYDIIKEAKKLEQFYISSVGGNHVKE